MWDRDIYTTIPMTEIIYLMGEKELICLMHDSRFVNNKF